jgi:hypothetical protein
MSYLITIIASFIIIYLADQLIRYLRDTYTVKKTKDVVGHHIDKYKSMMNEFHENNNVQSQPVQEREPEGIKLTNTDLIDMSEELNALITEDMLQ